jgi:hypothetical protein
MDNDPESDEEVEDEEEDDLSEDEIDPRREEDDEAMELLPASAPALFKPIAGVTRLFLIIPTSLRDLPESLNTLHSYLSLKDM